MAKGNMLLGMARGKVGDLVFTRLYGEQITRPRVRKIANPKTEKQMIQRMIFATVTAAYHRFQTIANHAFEGIAYGARSQQKFMSLNLAKLRAWYPVSASATALAAADPADVMAFCYPSDKLDSGVGMVLSDGSIPRVAATFDDDGALSYFGDIIPFVSTAATISHVLYRLGGLVAGDQITLVGLAVLAGGSYEVIKTRYVISAEATESQLSSIWNPLGTGNAYDTQKTLVDNRLLLTTVDNAAGTACTLRPTFSGVSVPVGCAMIISRKSSTGDWLRSPAILYNMQDEAPSAQAEVALEEWRSQGTEIATADDRYLNNADD